MKHYNDPYKPTSLMECHQGFEYCSFCLFLCFSCMRRFKDNQKKRTQQWRGGSKFGYCTNKVNQREKLFQKLLGGGNSNIFYFNPIPGEMIQFDEHIFQMGWFNHQLDWLDSIWVNSLSLKPPNAVKTCQHLTCFDSQCCYILFGLASWKRKRTASRALMFFFERQG